MGPTRVKWTCIISQGVYTCPQHSIFPVLHATEIRAIQRTWLYSVTEGPNTRQL